MKKLIVVLLALVAFLPVSAAVKKATLINSYGDKVVVAAGSSEAQKYFGKGYVLMGADISKPSKVCDCSSLGAASPVFPDSITVGGGEERWVVGSCMDATTTPFAVKNIWGDAFVDKVIFDAPGVATTTWTMDIGTSTSFFAAPSEAFLDDLGAATSAAVIYISDNGTNAPAYGIADTGTNSQSWALWQAGEYINGVITTGYTEAFTSGNNTFTCKYKIHMIMR